MSRVLKNLFGSGWTFVYSLAASGIITYLGSAWITRNLLETESQGRWAMPLAMIFLLLALVTATYRHDARALVLMTIYGTVLGHFVTSSMGAPGLHTSSLWYAAAGSAFGYLVLGGKLGWFQLTLPKDARLALRNLATCALIATPALVFSTYHLHDKWFGVLLLAEVGLLATAILGNTRPRENYPHSRALAR